MHILIISQFYAPDITAAAFRIKETVHFLKLYGHDVRVITTFPHKTQIKGFDNGAREPGVYRVKIVPYDNGGLKQYLKHYISFVQRSFVQGLKLRLGAWRPDVIWTTSPPLFTGLTGYLLAKLYHCPFVFDIRDIWPESAVAANQISQNGKAFCIGKILEKTLYRISDHITCVSHSMSEYIKSKTKSSVSVIYNGVSNSLYSQQQVKSIRKRILYAGNFGRVQGLDVLIRAFAAASRKGILQGWSIELIGAGALEDALKNLSRELGVEDRVIFCPPISKERVFTELASSGLLFINLKADEVFSLTIPSKVFDYMLANRPIIYGLTGEGKNILEMTGGNVCFFPSDENSLIEAFRKASSELQNLETKAKNNSQIVLGKYSREKAVEELISVFRQICK